MVSLLHTLFRDKARQKAKDSNREIREKMEHFRGSLLVLNAFEEPGLGVAPLALDGAFRQIQDLRNLRLSETGEETEFHDFRLLGGMSLKLFEGFIELQNNFFLGRGGDLNLIQRDFLG